MPNFFIINDSFIQFTSVQKMKVRFLKSGTWLFKFLAFNNKFTVTAINYCQGMRL